MTFGDNYGKTKYLNVFFSCLFSVFGILGRQKIQIVTFWTSKMGIFEPQIWYIYSRCQNDFTGHLEQILQTFSSWETTKQFYGYLSIWNKNIFANFCFFDTPNMHFLQIVVMGDLQMTFGDIWAKTAVFYQPHCKI